MLQKKVCKYIFNVFSFFLILTQALLVLSCKTETEPALTQPIVTLTLSEDSPQTSVIISWTPSDEVIEERVNYFIERSMIRDDVLDTRVFDWEADTPLCITDNTCESGTEYTYIVTASVERFSLFNSKTYSKKSEKKSIKTAKDSRVTLDYPKNLKVLADSNKRNALTVTWDAVENADSYELYYTSYFWSNFNEEFIKIAEIADTNETSFIKNYLTNEQSYTFMVKAVNGDKCSLFSAKASGRVPALENLSKDKAIMLENGIREYFYSNEDSLWFKCKPNEGFLSFYCEDYNQETSLSIFLEDGSLIASGLPLFIPAEGQASAENLTLLTVSDDQTYDYAVKRNIRADIAGFSSDTTYLLRIVKYYSRNFSICVE